MRIQGITCGPYQENAYLIYRDAAPQALLVDPGDALDALCRAVDQSGKKLGAMLLTHGHFDHALAAHALRDKYGCPVYIHRADGPYLGDEYLSCYDGAAARLPFTPIAADALIDAAPGGTSLCVCGYQFIAYHTPGHTPGSVCYQLAAEGALFTGDTLFARGYGRMDLPGGSEEQMAASLRRLVAMPRSLTIYPGHGPTATLGQAGDLLW